MSHLTPPLILECLEHIVHQIHLTKQTGPPTGKQITLAYHNTLIMTHIIHRPHETPASPHAYENQQPPTQPHLTLINL